MYAGYFGGGGNNIENNGNKFDLRKYQWLMMVDKLVKELNLKPDEVYEMNYISCLNWLSMYDQLEKIKNNK